MCGIGGYYAFGSKRPTESRIASLMVALQIRGDHASGIAYTLDGGKKVKVYKQPVAARKFVKHNGFKRAFKNQAPQAMICHTRYATQGDKADNKNNHPIYNKSGMVIVHNGMIYNDEFVFKDQKFKRDAEVDSEVILRTLESKGTWEEGVKETGELLDGVYAVAALDTHRAGDLCIFRSGNPVTFYMDVKNDIIYFASTESIIDNSFNLIRGFVIESDLQTFTIEDDTGIVINEKGLSHKFQFDSYYSAQPNSTSQYNNAATDLYSNKKKTTPTPTGLVAVKDRTDAEKFKDFRGSFDSESTSTEEGLWPQCRYCLTGVFRDETKSETCPNCSSTSWLTYA